MDHSKNTSNFPYRLCKYGKTVPEKVLSTDGLIHQPLVFKNFSNTDCPVSRLIAIGQDTVLTLAKCRPGREIKAMASMKNPGKPGSFKFKFQIVKVNNNTPLSEVVEMTLVVHDAQLC